MPVRRGEQPLPVSASFAGLLPAINHKGTPSYVMRVYGPNGTAGATAAAPARLRALRFRATAGANPGCGVADAGRHRRAHRIAGYRGAGGTAPARGQAWPP